MEELSRKPVHKNTLRISGHNMEVTVPLKPEIFGIEGMFFSNRLSLHLQSFDGEEDELKYSVYIRKESSLSGEPSSELLFEQNELGPDTEIDLSAFSEGNYVLYAKAYKTIASGEDITSICSESAKANFTILKKEELYRSIGYESGVAQLRRRGLFSTGNEYLNESLIDLLRLDNFKEGLFLTLDSPHQSDRQYHEGIVTILDKTYEIVYEMDDEGKLKAGYKKGFVYIPKDEIKDADYDSIVIVNIKEYADPEKKILLDEFRFVSTVTDLGGLFVTYDKNSPSIFMTEPEEGKSQINVNLVFSNISLASLICAYEIIHDGESLGLKLLSGISTNILLNAPGEYTIKAYTFLMNDDELKNPVAFCEKHYQIAPSDCGFEVTCPAKVTRGETLCFDIRTDDDKAEFNVKLKRYTDNIYGKPFQGGYHFELPLTDDIPVGLQVILCEDNKGNCTSKQFEVLRPGDNSDTFNLAHFKKIIIEGTAFIFSGYNIRYFAALAMESFARRCNIPKSQIFYFDDCSTDGTKEELESRGFSVISWNDEIFQSFSGSDLKEYTDVRIEQIMKSCASTIHSRYLCFIDGDTFFEKNAVDMILNHILLRDKTSEEFDLFGIIKNSYSEDELTLRGIGESIMPNFLWYEKEKVNSILMDATEIKETLNVLKRAGSILFHRLFSPGNNLYNLVKDSGLKIVLKDEEEDKEWLERLKGCVSHIGSLSTSARELELFGGDWITQLKNVQEFLDRSDISIFLTDIGLEINQVKFSFYSKILKN